MAQQSTKKKAKLAAKLKRREDSSVALGQALHALGGTRPSHNASDPTSQHVDVDEAPESDSDQQESTP